MDPDQVQVLTSTNYTYGVNISVGQTAWIPFVIQIPPLTIAPVQVSILRITLLGSISPTKIESNEAAYLRFWDLHA